MVDGDAYRFLSWEVEWMNSEKFRLMINWVVCFAYKCRDQDRLRQIHLDRRIVIGRRKRAKKGAREIPVETEVDVTEALVAKNENEVTKSPVVVDQDPVKIKGPDANAIVPPVVVLPHSILGIHHDRHRLLPWSNLKTSLRLKWMSYKELVPLRP